MVVRPSQQGESAKKLRTWNEYLTCFNACCSSVNGDERSDGHQETAVDLAVWISVFANILRCSALWWLHTGAKLIDFLIREISIDIFAPKNRKTVTDEMVLKFTVDKTTHLNKLNVKYNRQSSLLPDVKPVKQIWGCSTHEWMWGCSTDEWMWGCSSIHSECGAAAQYIANVGAAAQYIANVRLQLNT
jgi:hypothetical protein